MLLGVMKWLRMMRLIIDDNNAGACDNEIVEIEGNHN